MEYSDQRGLHIIGDKGGGNNPIVIIGNGGCMEYNSPYKYVASLNESGTHPDIYDGDLSDGPLAYAFTKPGDKLILTISQNQENNLNALLTHMNVSFEAIGLKLTKIENIIKTTDLSSWIKENGKNITPHILSPRMLPLLARNDQEVEQMRLQALLHTALYSKIGFITMCQKYDIPVPPTLFHTYHPQAWNNLIQQLQKTFPDIDKFVISADHGVASSGVRKGITIDSIMKNYLEGLSNEGNTIFTQPQYELIMGLSPCCRFALLDGTEDQAVKFLGASAQRFNERGEYQGNKGSHEIIAHILSIDPKFLEINYKTAQMLQQLGVRGVINLDSLITVNGTLMREANIRPAMSQWFSRLEQGIINQKHVTRIHTKMGIHIPDHIFQNSNLVNIFNNLCDENARVVIGTRYTNGETYLAFVGNDNIDENALNDIEKRVTDYITNNTNS